MSKDKIKISLDINKWNWIRTPFAFKVAKILDETTLIINVDYSSINQYIKTNQNWGLKDLKKS